jgi:hypothetical protein
MALQAGPDPKINKKKPKLSESTRLLAQEVSPEKDKATEIVNELMVQLSTHERTKNFLLAKLQGVEPELSFESEGSRNRILKNVQAVISQIRLKAKKEGANLQKVEDALLADLEIDDMQRRMSMGAFEVHNPHDKEDIDHAINTKDIKLLVHELSHHPDLKKEVFEIIDQIVEYSLPLKSITRMKKSTEAKQLALKIHQAEMSEQFLQNQ